MTKLAIKTIKVYQYISKNLLRHATGPFMLHSACNFYPTCSDYAVESFTKYGFSRGFIKTIKRILRCHPWATPGVDLP